MRIYLATWMEDNQGRSLQKIGYRNRLMSFFFLKDTEKNILKKYVINGFLTTIKKEK